MLFYAILLFKCRNSGVRFDQAISVCIHAVVKECCSYRMGGCLMIKVAEMKAVCTLDFKQSFCVTLTL